MRNLFCCFAFLLVASAGCASATTGSSRSPTLDELTTLLKADNPSRRVLEAAERCEQRPLQALIRAYRDTTNATLGPIYMLSLDIATTTCPAAVLGSLSEPQIGEVCAAYAAFSANGNPDGQAVRSFYAKQLNSLRSVTGAAAKNAKLCMSIVLSSSTETDERP